MKEMWVGYNVGCTMGFLLGHSAWQINQFPACWPMNGLFVHWSRGWGVSSFSERLVYPQPSGLEGYCHSAGGRAGGCQTCVTHISVTAWQISVIWSSVELSRPVVVHCHGNWPIWPIWACLWAKNLSNLAQIGSKLCGTHISENAWWI